MLLTTKCIPTIIRQGARSVRYSLANHLQALIVARLPISFCPYNYIRNALLFMTLKPVSAAAHRCCLPPTLDENTVFDREAFCTTTNTRHLCPQKPRAGTPDSPASAPNCKTSRTYRVTTRSNDRSSHPSPGRDPPTRVAHCEDNGEPLLVQHP